MRSNSLLITLAWLVCSCASSQPTATNHPTNGSTSAVSKRFALVGDDGVLVEVIELADDDALIRVSGLEGPLQNKVVSHRRAQDGQDLRYTTQWSGREWLTLLRSGDSGWLGTYWRLYMPGAEAIPLAYSEARTDKLDGDDLIALHEQQQRSGELEQLQSFDQPAERGREDEEVTTSAKAASRECDSQLSAAIAWDTVSDQALREHRISDYCNSALRALKSACYASPEQKAFIQKQVKDVSCRFDGAGEMNLDAGHLTWSVNLELGDLDSMAGQALSQLALPKAAEPPAGDSAQRAL